MEGKKKVFYSFYFESFCIIDIFKWRWASLSPRIVLLVLMEALVFVVVRCETFQAPRFISHPSSASSIVNEGSTKILQCQAIGYPVPVYKWLKDGQDIGDFSPEHYYKISVVRREDAGSYQCVARNAVGSVLSQKIDVTVAYMGKFSDLSEKLVTVEHGQAAVLDFPPIESFPEPLVTWQMDRNTFTSSNSDVIAGISRQLIILSVSDIHEGSYRARVTNTHLGRDEFSPYVRLMVRGGNSLEVVPPKIIVQPQDSHIIKGRQSCDLHCITNARPLYSLETIWLKDGIAVENTGISYLLNDPWNRTLSLQNANLTHTGKYTCVVKLRNTSFPIVQAVAQVTVQESPIFTSALRQEVLGEYNSAVKLPCEAIGIPVPTITWYRNAVQISPTFQDNRYTIEEGGMLVIKKLAIEDSGVFQCVASNDAGSDSIVTWIKVKSFAPIVETLPQNITVMDGKDATFSCRVAGAPMPNTTWFFQDSRMIQPVGRYRYLESGELVIIGTKQEDGGKYTCRRSNDGGSVEVSAYLTVLVRARIVQSPAATRVLLGNDAMMKCKISVDQAVPFQLSWFHNNRSIVGGNQQRIRIADDGTLYIHAVRPSDVGEYSCVLISATGNDTRSAKLDVIELPFSPTLVKAERVDQKSVNVSWTYAFDGNSPILKYVLQKREVPELGPIVDPLLSWTTELSNISAGVNWVILHKLKAATSYQFRVSAVNAVGEGSPSDPSNVVQLPQEPPSSAPLGFAGSARSSTEIITQWQPPPEDSRNGRILGYVIRYRLYGYNESPWTYQNITNEAQKNFLIQELITWKDYILQVAAYNEKGIGIFSDSIKVKTKEGVPEMAPSDVKASPINSTAIQVWWRPPNPQHVNGINQGYKLQAWKEERLSRIITVPPNLLDPLAEQMAVIGELEKYTQYNVTVLCFTDPGDGPSSPPILVLTDEDVSDEVANLHFQNISDRSVTIVWGPPKHTNGVLMGYTVSYKIRDRLDSLKSENVTGNTTQIIIRNLMPNTHYRFEIFAWTRMGRSAPRTATIQSGVEPVLPYPPTKLAVTNIEAFSVVLQFTPGFDGNSSIMRWIVEAQTTRNTSWFTVYEEANPDATTLLVNNLIPFTMYRLRLIAVNVVGPSNASDATKEFQTIQASPAHPPWNVTVRAISATELRVRWIPLQQSEWYGNARGYNISYKEISSVVAVAANTTMPETFVCNNVTIEDPSANSYILDKLQEYTLFEIVMIAFNDVGFSLPSLSAIERTRESVPSSGPTYVVANATSSTTIVVQWGSIPVESRNGQIDGYKVYYGLVSRSSLPVSCKDIPSNSTFTTTLTQLRKFSQYNIQVLAYNRLGDGVLSDPPVRVLTFEDTPGPPSNVSFPDVSLTTAKIIWDVPDEPNGEILAYRVNYHIQSSGNQNFSREFPASDRTYLASELESEQYYLFSVVAQTRLGWGKTAQALVYTTQNREHPQPPSVPHIGRSEVQATQITFSWTPGRDGFAPLRYYTIQKSENSGPWLTALPKVDPSLTVFTVTDLKPFTNYRFRIQATNDIGPSAYSRESPLVRTLPAAPSRGVDNVRVVPITTTSVHVRWTPVDEPFWSGDLETGGYNILFQPVSDFPVSSQMSPKLQVRGASSSEATLSELIRDRNYEIVVLPYNSQGEGPMSLPITVYVGEAIPTGQPQSVEAKAVSATEVQIKWLPPQQSQQNGELLGYKIFYLVIESPQEEERKIEEEIEVVPATYRSHSLIFLDKYTEYKIQILAFNPAGDGPRSDPIFVRTHQGSPGPPGDLQFSEITMNSFRVSWSPPKKKNGELIGYIVTYETVEQDEKFSKQVKQKVTDTSMCVHTLEEEVTYIFSVRAQTIDYGPAIKANITTGPQPGSPAAPRDLYLTGTMSNIEIKWINGASGKGPILGYYIQSKRKDDNRWITVAHTNSGSLEEFLISYHNLLPSTMYYFRVIAYNKFGVSYPITSNDPVLIPSKLFLEYGYLKKPPFYRQSWFVVVLAASSVIITIAIIAVLCVKSKSYKYKKEAQKSLEVSFSMDMNDRHQLALEMCRSRRISNSSLSRMTTGEGATSGTLSKRNTLNRKSQIPSNVSSLVSKSPPRPSPANVVYHSDEESLKDYDENPDDSSLTEKASEISSSDQASESENESVRSDPHSFVNHYANINDSLRQSWKRQKPVRNYSSYTDSEPESSAVVSLNGGQIVMNNMARSRAPLPGFSSFV